MFQRNIYETYMTHKCAVGVGKISVETKLSNEMVTATLVVVESNCKPLLGRDFF